MGPGYEAINMLISLFMGFFYLLVLIALGRIWHYTKRLAESHEHLMELMTKKREGVKKAES